MILVNVPTMALQFCLSQRHAPHHQWLLLAHCVPRTVSAPHARLCEASFEGDNVSTIATIEAVRLRQGHFMNSERWVRVARSKEISRVTSSGQAVDEQGEERRVREGMDYGTNKWTGRVNRKSGGNSGVQSRCTGAIKLCWLETLALSFPSLFL